MSKEPKNFTGIFPDAKAASAGATVPNQCKRALPTTRCPNGELKLTRKSRPNTQNVRGLNFQNRSALPCNSAQFSAADRAACANGIRGLSWCCRHKVAALDLGTDDCLIKPFGIVELPARLHVALRASTPQSLAAALGQAS
jgi:hypothetical protein